MNAVNRLLRRHLLLRGKDCAQNTEALEHESKSPFASLFEGGGKCTQLSNSLWSDLARPQWPQSMGRGPFKSVLHIFIYYIFKLNGWGCVPHSRIPRTFIDSYINIFFHYCSQENLKNTVTAGDNNVGIHKTQCGTVRRKASAVSLTFIEAQLVTT